MISAAAQMLSPARHRPTASGGLIDLDTQIGEGDTGTDGIGVEGRIFDPPRPVGLGGLQPLGATIVKDFVVELPRLGGDVQTIRRFAQARGIKPKLRGQILDGCRSDRREELGHEQVQRARVKDDIGDLIGWATSSPTRWHRAWSRYPCPRHKSAGNACSRQCRRPSSQAR